MAILAECPYCHRKQSNRNKKCSFCEINLDNLKRANKVRYWIDYRVPGTGQRREAVGFSIEEARDAEGKRRGQKRENRIFDMLPESKMTFSQLAEWYQELKTVKKLKSYDRIKLALKNFNMVFGDIKVNNIKPIDIENYQEKRADDGRAPATIDMEVKIAQTAVTKAFDNDKIDGRALKAFRKVRRKLKKGSNARKRILTISEYLSLIENAPSHLKAMIIIGFNTGMRAGEIRELKWSYIDRKKKIISLPPSVTKEKRSKVIPINHHVGHVLDNQPRGLKHDYVIIYKGQPIKQKDGFKRSFRTTCKNAEIPCGRNALNGITFHDIRRTAKTNMMLAGIDKALRDTILGHSLQGMDAHYISPSEENLQSAMRKYTDWIDSRIRIIVEEEKVIKV